MTVSNDTQKCPDCGTVLAGSLPTGLCPACLMEKALIPNESEIVVDKAGLAATQSMDPNARRPGMGESKELVPGQRFGDYQIVRRLGRGGMGTVYEADHGKSGRRVALKVLAHALDDREARARFLREGRLAASINHPNSVYVYGTEEIAGVPTISMELIRGGTLQQWVRQSEKIEVSAAVDAVLQVIDGLEAADKKGVLHRDVKPANCFIDPSGLIKVGDFGLSITTGPRDDRSITQVTREGAFLGTPAYASPEQLRGEPLDRRSDIYSVGVTLFYLLARRAPFTGENMVQLLATALDRDAPSLKSLRADIPLGLSQIVERCLQKSAGQRFDSYDSLRQELTPFSSSKLEPAALGSRVLANLIDIALMTVVLFVATYGWQVMVYGEISIFPHVGDTPFDANSIGVSLAWFVFCFLYYVICDWRYGRTIGKHIMWLRVVSDGNAISIRQAMIRGTIFFAVPNSLIMFRALFAQHDLQSAMDGEVNGGWIGVFAVGAYYVLRFGLFATIRKSNGYSGIHELASDTRVVTKPRGKARFVSSIAPEEFRGCDSEERIGPYAVLKELWSTRDERLVLGYDTKLLRRVWLHVRSVGTPEVDANARGFGRVGRLRWLGAKRSANECWDCYEAPTGRSYVEATNGEASNNASWEVVIDWLTQIATELKTSCTEQSLSLRTTVGNLWVTDENIVKLLPFSGDAHTSSVADTTENSPTPNAESTANRLIHDAIVSADQFFQSPHFASCHQSIPLGVAQSIERMANTPSTSLEVTNRDMAKIAEQPSFSLRRRARGLLTASMFLPALVVASSLMAGVAWEYQRSQYPEVDKLAKAATLLNILHHNEAMLKKSPFAAVQRDVLEDSRYNIESVKTWIAGNYRDVINDPKRFESNISILRMSRPTRTLLRELVREVSPTKEQTERAGLEYQNLSRTAVGGTMVADTAFLSIGGAFFGGAYMWLFAIWLPSLVSAIVCRGGILLRIFGLTLADHQGQPASRMRVFIRMFLGGIPALALVGTTFGSFSISHPIQASGVIVLVLVPIAIYKPLRLVHDRIAGTRLLAR